jgi:hypothetical protein
MNFTVSLSGAPCARRLTRQLRHRLDGLVRGTQHYELLRHIQLLTAIMAEARDLEAIARARSVT